MKKTTYVWAITLVIVGLMITSASSIPTPQDENEANSIKVVKSDKIANTLKIDSTNEVELNRIPQVLGDPAFAFEGDQLHPGFGRTLSGMQMASYRDDEFGQIIWTFSADDGASYDPGVYYEIGGDYPSIKQWDGNTFYGTHVTDYEDVFGGATYLFKCTDPSDSGTYELVYWDWSGYGWYDMIDADIACDNSQNMWEWGFSSYVISTTYESSPYINGPTFTYMDPDEDGSGWISWYQTNNCSHTDIDLDHSTFTAYAVYDQDEFMTGNWALLCRVKDFESAHQGSDSLYDITGGGNLQYPAVAAQEGNIIILAETDENGNKDIVCLYGSSVTNLQESFVADSGDDELYPDVRHVQFDKFVCTFVKDGKLYKSVTEDAGATWSTPEEVEDNVEEEYKTSDLTEFAIKAMYETSNGEDLDIYITDIDEGPIAPILEITEITGGIGVHAIIKNVGNADATNVAWTISVVGGILGLIDTEVSDTEATLGIGAELPVSSGLILGLGAIEITVTAECDEGASATDNAEGTQIIIFTMI